MWSGEKTMIFDNGNGTLCQYHVYMEKKALNCCFVTVTEMYNSWNGVEFSSKTLLASVEKLLQCFYCMLKKSVFKLTAVRDRYYYGYGYWKHSNNNNLARLHGFACRVFIIPAVTAHFIVYLLIYISIKMFYLWYSSSVFWYIYWLVTRHIS